MFIINMRSSALTAYLSCEHRYFCEYVLGLRGPTNFFAMKGTAFHKAMELLNKQQLAIQKKEKTFSEGDDGIVFKVNKMTPKIALDWAYNYYSKKYHEFEWTPKVYKEMEGWLYYTLESDYAPSKLNILAAEHFFEYEIKEPWAYYEYPVQGNIIKGHLKVRGTLDLLIKHNDEYLEYQDYKTGRYLYDWNKGREKTTEELKHDPQLLLYYYSLKREFPMYPHLGMTLFYLKGGPCAVQFGREEYDRARDLIKTNFLKIKNVARPAWIFEDDSKNRQCTYCAFNKTFDKTTGKSLCKKYRDEVVTLGMNKVVDKYIDLSKVGDYVGGGAVRNATSPL